MKQKMTLRNASPKESQVWDLCLYVADDTPRSLMAIENLNSFCEKWLPNRCRIEVVDVCADPQAARTENIVALPTLVRKSPRPMRRVVGVLSDMERVLSGLGVRNVA